MDRALLADHTVDGMLVLDGGGTILYANPAATRMFGRQVEGATLGLPLAPDGPVEVEIHSGNGQEGYAEMRLSPLVWQGQTATLASLRDVTDRQRAQQLLEQKNAELEQARRQAEAGSRAKTQFLAMMSHELRTPMSAVLGMLELLSEGELEDQQRDYIRLADTGARELLSVLDDILDISKIEAGHIKLRPHPFSLAHGLSRMVGVMQTEARHCRLHLDVPDELPETVVGDWGRLRQVLLNLLGNALKFCDTDCGLRVPLAGFTDELPVPPWSANSAQIQY